MKRVQFYAIIAVLCVLVSGSALYADSYFQRGDANADGVPDIADAIFLLANLFSGGADPVCRDAADVNDDGMFDIADAIAMLSELFIGPVSCLAASDANDDDNFDIADPIYALAAQFSGGPVPPSPFMTCGIDPTPGLPCDAYPSCP